MFSFLPLSTNQGRAIFESGSPFPPVEYKGKVFVPGQSNNAYIFPGFGLGLIMSGTIRVHDDLLLAASEALAEQVTEENFEKGLIFPPFTNIRKISAHIAAKVAAKAYELGLATRLPQPKDLEKFAESFYLMNMTTNVRIWKALNSQSDGDHLGLIKKVLRPCHDGGENCKFCSQKKLFQAVLVSQEDIIPSCFLPSNSEIDDFLKILSLLSSSILLPELNGRNQIEKFCLSNACLVLCTVSSSIKLYTDGMTQVKFLVIDEAAQFKECESTIPLQLPGLQHCILIGDEKKLPALVKSKIADSCGFGRSMFERLVILGYKKHMLNVQYRMHPNISLFPCKEFYDQKISDAPFVMEESYNKSFLEGELYSSYSFINIAKGKEKSGRGHNLMNMVEVAVISEMIKNLKKEFKRTQEKVSIGVISPYNAQVYAIQDKINQKKELDKKVFKIGQKSTKKMQSQIEKKKKQCINEDVEKDDINDEIQEDDINDKIQEDDLNDKIQEDDVDDEFQEDDIDLDDEFQEEDIDGEFQEDDVDEEFMEDDISNEFQEDDLDALLLEDKLE
ncbi:unnamed protein product [Vicia faba]|uniref:Malic enzyme NAD-binding domain-containing protein n=2 Tax=Vicia faba TaxID=3906 RepID=A0AAV1B9M8_VICFA|nr:unnamed protein product [Vicia faba]